MSLKPSVRDMRVRELEEIRASALLTSKNQIERTLSQWPRAVEISPRPLSDKIELYVNGLPNNPYDRRECLIQKLWVYWDRLKKDESHYDEIRSVGIEALDYSSFIQNDYDPVKALNNLLNLKTNHISYGKSIVDKIIEAIARVDSELLDLPGGYEFVDVVLPGFKAFVVKEWAKQTRGKGQLFSR